MQRHALGIIALGLLAVGAFGYISSGGVDTALGGTCVRIGTVLGLLWLAWGLLSGRIRRDLVPTRADLAPSNLRHEIVTHAKLRFPKGEKARRYNVLQKLTYLLVTLIVLPLMIATGLAMSPGLDAGAHWLVELFGGRQSARSIHFICASLIVLFVLVHLAMVVASGPWNNLRSMITGRYRIETEGEGA